MFVDPYELDLQLERDLADKSGLPSGRARCACGRSDLLSVSTTDGRRILLEAAPDGGEWAIRNDRARIVAEGGDLNVHNCRRHSDG